MGVSWFATSTTDASLTAGAAAGSDFACSAVVWSAVGTPLAVLLSDSVRVTERFGLLCVTTASAASAASEPDFLSLTVADFLSVLLVSLPFDSATPAAPSLSPPLAWSSPDDAEEGVDPGEPADEPDEDDEEEPAEDGESVDELDEPESDGPAHATPGVVATAAPTPKPLPSHQLDPRT